MDRAALLARLIGAVEDRFFPVLVLELDLSFQQAEQLRKGVVPLPPQGVTVRGLPGGSVGSPVAGDCRTPDAALVCHRRAPPVAVFAIGRAAAGSSRNARLRAPQGLASG